MVNLCDKQIITRNKRPPVLQPNNLLYSSEVKVTKTICKLYRVSTIIGPLKGGRFRLRSVSDWFLNCPLAPTLLWWPNGDYWNIVIYRLVLTANRHLYRWKPKKLHKFFCEIIVDQIWYLMDTDFYKTYITEKTNLIIWLNFLLTFVFFLPQTKFYFHWCK